jgi:hypothetical protein
MRMFIFTCSVLTALTANADKGEKSRWVEPTGYVVVSDEYNVDVPAGQCIVFGTVHEQNPLTGELIPLAGAMISTLDAEHKGFTDSTGTYRLVLDSRDTTIYMFHQGFEEIILWNYKFQSQHVVRIDFYPGIDYSMISVDKPVIYLYSDKELEASVTFSCKGDLTFTYPAYNNGWNVTVGADGIIQKPAGKKYPYLFWEATTDELNYEITEKGMEGFVISTDTAVQFLENSLTALGLTSTERTDFITFWAPRMIANPYALIQFFVDDQYEANISSMTITPRPDAMRRVFMMFTPLQSPNAGVVVSAQQFAPFERSGFTVVEWGGSEMPEVIIP